MGELCDVGLAFDDFCKLTQSQQCNLPILILIPSGFRRLSLMLKKELHQVMARNGTRCTQIPHLNLLPLNFLSPVIS